MLFRGMTSEEVPGTDGGFKTHNLSLTIGSGEDEDEEVEDDLQTLDMRSRMQSFALDDGYAMPPTIFVDDSDVMLMPTTSSSMLQEPVVAVGQQAQTSAAPLSLGEGSTADIENFVKDFFASDSRRFNAPEEGNFIEEIYAEKQPKFIGDYLFGSVIGEGSYSKVKEVLNTRTLVRRAVKIIKDKRLRKIPGGEQNVQREIKVLKRVHHVNVVELFEAFRMEEKQKLYIVMEFCVCSLQQMLDNCVQKKLPEFQAHLYFAQMLDGLDYLHSQGIIHKDIKPGNLLLSLDGKIKICDMGVAEVLHEGDADIDVEDDWCSIAQGTPKFQPPEVVSGTYKRFRGRLVDIWSCGVTLFNLVSGEYPFEGDVIMKLFENITTQPLRMPSSVVLSSSLSAVLNGVLEKKPDLRWDSARIRQSEWFLADHEIVIPYPLEQNDWPLLRYYRLIEEMQDADVWEEGESSDSPKESKRKFLSTGDEFLLNDPDSQVYKGCFVGDIGSTLSIFSVSSLKTAWKKLVRFCNQARKTVFSARQSESLRKRANTI